MASNQRPFTGKAGIVKIDAVTLHVTNWDATESCDWQDATDTGSNGFEEQEPGNKKLEGSASFLLKRDNWPYGASPNLRAGVEPAGKFYFVDTASPIDVPKMSIYNIKVTSNQKGVTSGTFDWKANGAYTIPTSPPA